MSLGVGARAGLKPRTPLRGTAPRLSMLHRNALGRRRGITNFKSSHREGPAQGPLVQGRHAEKLLRPQGMGQKASALLTTPGGPGSGSAISSAGLGWGALPSAAECGRACFSGFPAPLCAEARAPRPTPGLWGLGPCQWPRASSLSIAVCRARPLLMTQEQTSHLCERSRIRARKGV